MDDQLVGGGIFWKIPAGGVLQLKLFSGVFPQPPGNLHRADVLALAVVGAALGNENFVAVLKPVNGSHALDSVREKALVPGHQDGEGGQGDVPWRVPVHLGKGLAVGDDHAGLYGQLLQGVPQAVLLYHKGEASGVQHIPKGLLLGQNEPALGGGAVDGGDQHHQVPGGKQVPHQALALAGRPGQPGHPLFQLFDARSLLL